MKLRRRIVGVIATASLALGVGGVAVAAPEAQAVGKCSFTNTYGRPLISNDGEVRSVKLRTRWLYNNYVWRGHPEYYCPTAAYVRRGHDMVFDCMNGVRYQMFNTGWHNIQDVCSANGGTNIVSFYEYPQ